MLFRSPETSLAVVTRAVIEVRGPMLFATTIIVLAALPVLFMQGLAAPFFKPLFWSYIVAVLASLAVALALTPAIACFLLANAALPARDGSALLARLQSACNKTLNSMLRTPLPALVLAAGGVVVGVLMWTTSERSWLPNFKETDVWWSGKARRARHSKR